VCDRERLIRELGDRALLREWTPPLAVDPTPEAVASYVAALHPATYELQPGAPPARR